MNVKMMISLIAFSMVACCKSNPTLSQPSTSSAAPTAPAPIVKSESEVFAEKLAAAKTIEDSLKLTKPIMGGAETNKFSGGHILFGLWCDQNSDSLSWKDFNVLTNETSSGLIQKNPKKESGKKICLNGRIIQIKESGEDLSEGLFMSGSDIYSFVAIKSSGELTERSSSKFCGYVTGTYEYTNSGGGIGHAISLVGMWGVPENLK